MITVSGLRVMGLELPINQSEDPITGGPNPWRDKRVREAANYAIDREAIIDNLLTGLELPAVSPFPAGYDLPLGPSGLPRLRPGQGARLAGGGGPGRLPDPVAHRDRHLGRRTLGAGHPAVPERRGLRVRGGLPGLRRRAAGDSRPCGALPLPDESERGDEARVAGGAGFAWTLIAAIGNPYAHTNADDDFLPEFLEFQALIEQGNGEFDEDKRNDIYWDAAVVHYEEAFNIPLFNLSHQHGARKDISYQGWRNADHSLNVRYLGVST